MSSLFRARVVKRDNPTVIQVKEGLGTGTKETTLNAD
jgi:hypothetical protein